MDQFANKEQIESYDESRPKYSDKIFEHIIKNTNNFDSYLDVACGTGQLLFPISKSFKRSIGVDVSSFQIAKAQEHLDAVQKKSDKKLHIHLLAADIYEAFDKLSSDGIIPSNQKFDLITVGQAFHWFDEHKILPFLKSLLCDNGTLVLAGYKKQHFDQSTQPELYGPFNSLIETLTPYFECDVNNTDWAYYKNNESFKKYFGEKNVVEPLYFEETFDLPVSKLLLLVKSWSAYVNIKKETTEGKLDVLEELEINLRKALKLPEKKQDKVEKKEDDEMELHPNPEAHLLDNTNIEFHNFYFVITLENK